MAQSGLSTLDESLANVGDAEGSLVGRDDVVVDDGGQVQSDVVLGHAGLLGDLGDLDLDVDLNEPLAERVDLDQARVDGLVEFAELRDETDIALADALVRVGAADAAGDSSQGTDDGAGSVD